MALTPEIEQRILALIRAGAFAHVAAQAAGIAERTFYDWLARGRGEHPTRGPSPKLRAFAREVERARAEARAAAEIRVYREHPKYWLSHAARSRSSSEGWTNPEVEGGPGRESELGKRLGELDHQAAIEERDRHRAACADPGCPSPLHQRRYDHDENCTHPLDPRSVSD